MTTMEWIERDAGPGHRSTVDHKGSRALGARYDQRGGELVLVVPIGAEEAANGSLIPVPVPGSSVKLRVPPGTRSGRKFTIPRPYTWAPDGFGDLTVIVEVR